MKERPILFSGPMVRAILEGRKTQTRRVVNNDLMRWGFYLSEGKWINYNETFNPLEFCRFGKPGDRLWVRETFMPMPHLNAKAFYRASDPLVGGKWKPSIFMPRDLCRVSLEISSVRVERLNEISETDAQAEGVERFSPNSWKNYEFKTAHPRRGEAVSDEKHRTLSYSDTVRSFKSLWQSINGPGSWDLNPWVWVVEFRKLDL